MSRVACHIFFIIIFFFFGQSAEAYRWRVCYQRGLPRLVFWLLGWFPKSKLLAAGWELHCLPYLSVGLFRNRRLYRLRQWDLQRLCHTVHPKTVRSRELQFWDNVHHPPCVTCHVSHVTCHMSHVTCHVSRVTTCHLSRVRCHMSHVFFSSYFFFRIKWWSLSVEGLLSTGPTPSSFRCYTLSSIL